MRDPRVEQWLEKNKIDFEYVERVPLAAINRDKTILLNTRLTDHLNQARVDQYALSAIDGDKFPAIVLSLGKKVEALQTYNIVSGNHRVGGFIGAELTVIDAYVLKVTDLNVLDRLRRVANVFEGEGLSEPERMQQALYFVGQGYSLTDAANLMRISYAKLTDRVVAIRVENELAKEGVDLTAIKISQSGIVAMNGIYGSTLKKFADLNQSARLPHDIISTYARELRRAPDDATKERLLAEWRRLHEGEIHESGGGTIKPAASNIRRLYTKLKEAERLIDGATPAVMTNLKPGEILAMVKSCRNTIAQLQQHIARLEEAHATVVGKH